MRYLINPRFCKNNFETRFFHLGTFYEKIIFRPNDYFWTRFSRRIQSMDILTLVGVQCHLLCRVHKCIGFFVFDASRCMVSHLRWEVRRPSLTGESRDYEVARFYTFGGQPVNLCRIFLSTLCRMREVVLGLRSRTVDGIVL